MRTPAPQFFRTTDELRAWFDAHHTEATELWIGFFKAHTGRSGVDYVAAVEEALCVGWIDTTVRRIDDDRYAHRFTPRRPGSLWSEINRGKLERLRREGRVRPAGEAAYADRAPDTTRYLFSGPATRWPSELARRFRADVRAWRNFSAGPPGYRRTATHWVLSAVRPETRERRFRELVATSRAGTRPRPFLVTRVERETADRGPGRGRPRPDSADRRRHRRHLPAALK